MKNPFPVYSVKLDIHELHVGTMNCFTEADSDLFLKGLMAGIFGHDWSLSEIPRSKKDGNILGYNARQEAWEAHLRRTKSGRKGGEASKAKRIAQGLPK